MDADQPHQDNDWETICEQGRRCAESLDAGRWSLGDIALAVEKRYGQDSIGKFATEINVKASRVREYRTVCAFYPSSARAEFLSTHPTLTYSHLRAAMRFEDMEEAFDFLEKAASEAWTVAQVEREIAVIFGKDKPFVLKFVDDLNVTDNMIVLTLPPSAVDEMRDRIEAGKTLYTVTLKGMNDEAR
jgi:hypothetical protein